MTANGEEKGMRLFQSPTSSSVLTKEGGRPDAHKKGGGTFQLYNDELHLFALQVKNYNRGSR